ncbi:hypothetical protein J1N35_007363 [Gossypium stocksii]|uniref:DUF4283 domain-containing protein n=1 Tax=Gossypium stocksii TaxID=47602 RepID=A0A9D4AFI8_9ROSI|nr:hypothetical protein J1N35_007363 [Gossypium stocksii]
MEEELANLNIYKIEDIPVRSVEEEVGFDEDYNLCLVGQLLTESVVHFPSLRNTLVDLWHPFGAISITDIGEKRVMFRFSYMIDLKWVMDGMPWFFNRHLIIFHKMEKGEDPMSWRGFLPIRLTLGDQVLEFEWDVSLRVLRRRMMQTTSPWLQDDSREEIRKRREDGKRL